MKSPEVTFVVRPVVASYRKIAEVRVVALAPNASQRPSGDQAIPGGRSSVERATSLACPERMLTIWISWR